MAASKKKIGELAERVRKARAEFPGKEDSRVISRVVLADRSVPYTEKSEVGQRVLARLSVKNGKH